MQRAILRGTWQARRTRRDTVAGGALISLPVLLIAWLHGVPAHRWLGALGLTWLLLLWWVHLAGLLRQNTPELARLLPGQLRALRLHLAASTLVAAVAGVACGALVMGPRASVPWLVMLALLVLAWSQREFLHWIAAGLLPIGAVAALRPNGWLAQLPAPPWPVHVLGLAGLAGLTLTVLGSGGAGHNAWAARRQRWLRVLQAPDRAQPGQPSNQLLFWLNLPVDWPQRLLRRAVLRRGAAVPALERLDLGLHVAGQWLMLLWLLVLVAAGSTAMLLLLDLDPQGRRELAQTVTVGLCIGLYALCGTSVERRHQLCGRPHEQGLLTLLPGLPLGTDLAAQLEAKWRREYLVLWCLATAWVLALAAWAGGGQLGYVAAAAGFCLPLVWWLQARQRRLAHTRLRTTWGNLWPMLVPVAAGLGHALPAGLSLAAGALAYLACARWAPRPARAMLPDGRC